MLCLYHAYAATCKTFSCKTFQTGPTDTCVYVNTTGVDQLTRNCNSTSICDAILWADPSAATNNASCHLIPSVDTKNKTLPGDKCTKSEDCFGLAAEVSCKSGVCTTNRTEGSACVANNTAQPPIVGHEWCPANYNCNMTTNKCQKQKVAGENCTTSIDCQAGLACIKNGTNTWALCVKYWSLEEGWQFDATLLNPNHYPFSKDDLCKTHQTIQVGTKYECRKPQVNNDAASLDSLKRSTVGSNCNYTAYDDATDRNKAVNKTVLSQCGFNKDDGSYCNKRKGDQWFTGAFNQLKAKDVSNITCHALSSLVLCPSYINTVTPTIYTNFQKELLGISGWNLYANNDACVANTITRKYWKDTVPGLANAMASFAAVILAVSTLFYMF